MMAHECPLHISTEGSLPRFIGLRGKDEGSILFEHTTYFTPDIKVDIINKYFNFLENSLDTLNYQVVLLGDFNFPGYDWNNGSPSPNCHFYTKLKEVATAYFTIRAYNYFFMYHRQRGRKPRRNRRWWMIAMHRNRTR
jgi:hypothetical protein